MTKPTKSDPAMRDFIKDTPLSEPNDGWAAEAGGEAIRTVRERYLIYATIERCAQKAREVCEAGGLGTFTDKLVAEILALKEKL